MPEMAKPDIFYRQLADGTIEGVDTLTGAVVVRGKDLYNAPEYASYVEIEINGQKILVQSGVHSPELPRKKGFPYSQALADVICQKIVQGAYLSKLHEIEGMPDLWQIALWRRQNKDFDDAIRYARKVRAEVQRDEAVEIAKGADGLDKDLIAGKKLAVDTLQWSAEKDDPEVYGNKVKVEGQALVALVVDTGIRRDGDTGIVSNETKKEGMLNDKNNSDRLQAKAPTGRDSQSDEEILGSCLPPPFRQDGSGDQ